MGEGREGGGRVGGAALEAVREAAGFSWSCQAGLRGGQPKRHLGNCGVMTRACRPTPSQEPHTGLPQAPRRVRDQTISHCTEVVASVGVAFVNSSWTRRVPLPSSCTVEESIKRQSVRYHST